ncbi:unnamed protein product [Microthlaspi erraticum]|uniref:Uncharacterized protein n=1 Tax=Microthlaspi erraticum TaxID=1685480 RepID=A0A6D2IPQ9_9BRAS|nr:unnamed protein product [Microthlaspi erraticum]
MLSPSEKLFPVCRVYIAKTAAQSRTATDPPKTAYLLEMALLCAGPGASAGESEIPDGVNAGVSIEGESAWDNDGGDATEDSGVGVFDAEGEIAGEMIRLPPPLNGAGAGD